MNSKLAAIAALVLATTTQAQLLYYGQPPLQSGFGGAKRAVSIRDEGTAPYQYIQCRYWYNPADTASSYASIGAFPSTLDYVWTYGAGYLYIRPAGTFGWTEFPLHLYTPVAANDYIELDVLDFSAVVTSQGLPGAYSYPCAILFNVATQTSGTFELSGLDSNLEVLRFRAVRLVE